MIVLRGWLHDAYQLQHQGNANRRLPTPILEKHIAAPAATYAPILRTLDQHITDRLSCQQQPAARFITALAPATVLLHYTFTKTPQRAETGQAGRSVQATMDVTPTRKPLGCALLHQPKPIAGLLAKLLLLLHNPSEVTWYLPTCLFIITTNSLHPLCPMVLQHLQPMPLTEWLQPTNPAH